MNKNDRDYLVQKIRTQYTEQEHTQLDALRELDRKGQASCEHFCLYIRHFRSYRYG